MTTKIYSIKKEPHLLKKVNKYELKPCFVSGSP